MKRAKDVVFCGTPEPFGSGTSDHRLFHAGRDIKKLDGPGIKQGEGHLRYQIIPELSEESYDMIAREMIRKYYMKSLGQPVRIEGEDLARGMGLAVRKIRLADGAGIMGQIYFCAGKAEVLDKNGERRSISVKKDTIIINTEECKTQELVNSTILHECAHRYLHFSFYLSNLRSKVSGLEKSSPEENLQRRKGLAVLLEEQAESLASHLLMGKGSVCQLIKEEHAISGSLQSTEGMQALIKRMMRIFCVPEDMAVERLIQLGYVEGRETCRSIGKCIISDHHSSKLWSAGIMQRRKREEVLSGYELDIRLKSRPGTLECREECKNYGKDDALWAQIMTDMPNEFRPAVNHILARKGITQMDLSRMLGVSRAYLTKILTPDISRAHLVGICVALDLRYDVSQRLFELAGMRLRYSGSDIHYYTLLMNPKEFTIEKCNEYLVSNGYEALFPKASSWVQK